MSWIAVVALSVTLAQAGGESVGGSSSVTRLSDAPKVRAEPRPLPLEESEDPSNPFAKRGYKVRTLIAGSLSGAMLVTSGTLYLLTWREYTRLNTPNSYSSRDEVFAGIEHGRRLQTATIITGAIGAAFGIGAGVMFLIDRPDKDRGPSQPRAHLVPSANGLSLVGTLP